MFFLMWITDGRKDFDFTQTIICDQCGKYGRYHVFMTYTVLTLFFIPCFKWNRHYYVETTCCNTLYELDPEIGERIAHGDNIEISSKNLIQITKGNCGNNRKKCSNCGFETDEDFEYCPKCGRHF